MKTWWRSLEALGACEDAVTWCKTQPSLTAAWASCERSDWMIWLIGRCSPSAPWSHERKSIVRLACAIARTALQHARGDAARLCIETVEAWCDEKATAEAVRTARAYAAAYAAADAAAAAAAYARRAIVEKTVAILERAIAT